MKCLALFPDRTQSTQYRLGVGRASRAGSLWAPGIRLFQSIHCCNCGSGLTACRAKARSGLPRLRPSRVVWHLHQQRCIGRYTSSRTRAAHRADHGKPRLLPQTELECYCELIAVLKLRTTNKQGRHLSTGRAIELMEDYGVETAQGLVKLPKGLLRRPAVNRYLSL